MTQIGDISTVEYKKRLFRLFTEVCEAVDFCAKNGFSVAGLGLERVKLSQRIDEDYQVELLEAKLEIDVVR